MKRGLTKLALVLMLALSVSMAYAYQVTVTSSQQNIAADGKSVIALTATVKNDDGTAAVEVPVTWSTSGLGTILDTSTATDVLGVATSRLRAPINTGTASVSAMVGTSAGTWPVHFVGPAINVVSVDPETGTLQAGTGTLPIFVQFVDAANNMVADGTSVSFSIVTSTGSTITQTALTQDGQAAALLTTGTQLGTVEMTATCGQATGTGNYLVVGPPASVDVSFSKPALSANGTSECTVFAYITDAASQAVADGLKVTFSTDNGTVTSSSLTKDGFAQATLTSSNTAQKATVTASVGQCTGDGAIGFYGTPSQISVSADKCCIAADGTSSTTISARLYDSNHSAIIDGCTVTFSTTGGTLSQTTVPVVDGCAEVTLTSAATPGQVTVTASLESVIDTESVYFSGAPSIIQVYSSVNSLNAGESSICDVFGVVSDSGGNPVPDGTAVTLTTSAGSIIGHATTLYGQFDSVFKSDLSPATASITASCGGTNASTSLYVAGQTANVSVCIQPSVLPADGSATALVTVVVSDSGGRPVADGTQVTFTTTRGQITTATSTSGGKAVAVLTADSTAGSGTVTATLAGLSTNASFTLN